MTFNFEPALPERFPTLRHYLAHRVVIHSKTAKVIAADMDMSPSLLTRKLTAGQNPDDKDTQRLNTEDLEDYFKATGPEEVSAVIEYLASKYLDSDEQRRARVISRLEGVLPELVGMLSALKAAA
jgi:myo-inositol catabolism protein IolC